LTVTPVVVEVPVTVTALCVAVVLTAPEVVAVSVIKTVEPPLTVIAPAAAAPGIATVSFTVIAPVGAPPVVAAPVPIVIVPDVAPVALTVTEVPPLMEIAVAA